MIRLCALAARRLWRVPKSTAQKLTAKEKKGADYGTLEHPRLVVGALSVSNDCDLPAAVEPAIDTALRHRSESFASRFRRRNPLSNHSRPAQAIVAHTVRLLGALCALGGRAAVLTGRPVRVRDKLRVQLPEQLQDERRRT